jgi:urease accessory protein
MTEKEKGHDWFCQRVVPVKTNCEERVMMTNNHIYDRIVGNLCTDADWRHRLQGMAVEYINLDQWTAQKSRFVVRDSTGREYAVALPRPQRITDGDILEVDTERQRVVVFRVSLSEVMEVDLAGLMGSGAQHMVQMAVELGHAIGNQHWPAVVKGMQVYVPLTVDKTVMRSVMETHHLEGLTYTFRPGQAVIPYLAPHEVRRLFGGADNA